MKLKPNDFRKIVIGSFLAVPALSSLISTIHIITFFGLGNMSWMAIILALAFEIGSIASLMTLTVLDKVNRFAVWFIFFVLVVMQMLGNVYYTYDFISHAMASNPQWIDSFIDLVEMMTMQKLEQRTTKFILSLLIGLPIPIISLAFLKSVSDYLKPESNVQDKVEVIEESKENKKEVIEPEEKIESEEEVEIEEKEEELEESLKPISFSGVNEQITDAVTQVEKIEETQEISEDVVESEVIIPESEEISNETLEINEESISPKVAEVIENIEDETNIEEEITEEIQEDIEEKKDDIYEEKEEEPVDSFFDDSTVEEDHDNFQEEQDDEKKSLS